MVKCIGLVLCIGNGDRLIAGVNQYYFWLLMNTQYCRAILLRGNKGGWGGGKLTDIQTNRCKIMRSWNFLLKCSHSHMLLPGHLTSFNETVVLRSLWTLATCNSTLFIFLTDLVLDIVML